MIKIFNKLINTISQIIKELEAEYKSPDNNFINKHERLQSITQKLDETILRLKILSIMNNDEKKEIVSSFLNELSKNESISGFSLNLKNRQN